MNIYFEQQIYKAPFDTPHRQKHELTSKAHVVKSASMQTPYTSSFTADQEEIS
jgi:hypothetical protein